MSPDTLITPWGRNDELARTLSEDTEAIGWENTQTGEVILRREGADAYIVEYYRDTWGNKKYGTNRRLLFRSDTPDVESRVRPYLTGSHTRRSSDHLDTVAIRQAELTDPQTLSEWGQVHGAECKLVEKVGSRTDSSGEVALFDGTHRWGDGAYVALAQERGPHGDEYISVGYRPNGYYVLETSGFTPQRNEPYEITNPTLTFDGERIIAENHRGKALAVTATPKARTE